MQIQKSMKVGVQYMYNNYRGLGHAAEILCHERASGAI